MKSRNSAFCPPFMPMRQVLEERECDGWQLEQFELGESEIALHRVLSHDPGEDRFTEPGVYMRLLAPGPYGKETVMSDTPNERWTNLDLIKQARGQVLIAGLGLGMVLVPLLRKPEVKRIVVIEKNQEVIDLVADQIQAWRRPKDARLDIYGADIFLWGQVERNTLKYDVLYFDIWNDVSDTGYQDSKQLWKTYRKFLAPGGWMGSWRRDDMKRLALGQ